LIAGLILAAGESSRMGTDKALLEYRGRTFLETIAQALRDAGLERITVVLGHHAEAIRAATNLEGAEVVVNKNYSQGQTSSLQAGLRALASSDIEAVVLCLVDHPAVSAETMDKLIAAFQESPHAVIVPTFQNQRGHPVLFARALFDELLQLTPETGANTIIRTYRGRTRFVEVEDACILLDIDSPDDYNGLPTGPVQD
jgi:molybdenum cofactor cytidylyltransferase